MGTSRIFFSFLEGYVATHFSLEEKDMTKFHVGGGEGAKEHRAEYRAFLRDFTAFKKESLENGSTTLLVEEFQKWILSGMAGHLGKTDRGLGRFLRSALPFLKRNGPLTGSGPTAGPWLFTKKAPLQAATQQ